MFDANNESIGRRIARLRLEHGMTQEYLASLMNVSPQAVSKWENDQSYPDISLLPLLSKTLGITVDELLGATSSSAAEQTTEPRAELAETQVMDNRAANVSAAAGPERNTAANTNAAAKFESTGTDAMSNTAESSETLSYVEGDGYPEEEYDWTKPTRLVIHITEGGKDAVNVTIPLMAVRAMSGLASFIPELNTGALAGVDLDELLKVALSSNAGTLVSVDDGEDHVHIALE